MNRNDLDHHRVRVREELDWAYRATATAAVHAHFRLAALHMSRIDELSRAPHAAQAAKPATAANVQPLGEERIQARC